MTFGIPRKSADFLVDDIDVLYWPVYVLSLVSMKYLKCCTPKNSSLLFARLCLCKGHKKFMVKTAFGSDHLKNRLKNIIASIFFIKLSVFPGNFIAFKVVDLSEMRQITKHAITPFWADLKVHKSC